MAGTPHPSWTERPSVFKLPSPAAKSFDDADDAMAPKIDPFQVPGSNPGLFYQSPGFHHSDFRAPDPNSGSSFPTPNPGFPLPDMRASHTDLAGSMLHPGLSAPHAGKRAIPRLPENPDMISPSRYHRRHVTRACEACRQRKTKCSGERSGCRNCKENGVLCCYTDGKREKSKRQMAGLEDKLYNYERVLKSMGTELGMTDDEVIASINVKSSNPRPDGPVSAYKRESPQPDDCFQLFAAHIPGHIEEDFSRDEITRATGFIGSSSEISWLQTVDREIRSWDATDDSSSGFGSWSPGGKNNAICFWDYHDDQAEIPAAPTHFEPSFPSKHTARRLFNTYLTHVHPSFPIIGSIAFSSQFDTVLRDAKISPAKRWVAILNLIFAIAARFVQMTDPGWDKDQEDHHLFFTRSRVLDMQDDLFQHADLQKVQLYGLTSLYLLVIGQMNRSWKLCGLAMLGAVDLGLHLRNTSASIPDDSREIRYRVWWALYTLEHRLSVMTGRPSCLNDSSFSTPLPIPFDESEFKLDEAAMLLSNSAGRSSQLRSSTSPEQLGVKARDKYDDCDIYALPPSDSSLFLQFVLLTSVGRRTNSELYGPQAARLPWSTTRWKMKGLLYDLNNWLMNLPSMYDFTLTQTSPSLANQRTFLALTYYSTKIGITRPCLCRMGQNNTDREIESFCKEQAGECIEAALLILRFLPDSADPITLYKTTPWWNMPHFLMQSAAVLLLELSFSCQHWPENENTITRAAEKVYEWLGAISRSNKTTQRAWHFCGNLLRRLGKVSDCGTPVPGSNVGNTPSNEPSHPPDPGPKPSEHSRLFRSVSDREFLAMGEGGISSYSQEPGTGFLEMLNNEDPLSSFTSSGWEHELPRDPNTGEFVFFNPDDPINTDYGQMGDC